MKKTIVISLIVLAAGGVTGTIAAPAAEKHNIQIASGMACKVCGMYIEVFRRTAVELAFDDGATQRCCGVSCGLRLINEHLGLPHVKSAYVTDWITQEAVPLNQATLVVDSDETPDMIPNIIAFQSGVAARAFQQEHGGSTLTLERALAEISYQGMTMPFRITPAPTPPARVFSAGAMVSGMVKDNLLKGHDEASAQDVLKNKPMVPKKMESTMVSVAAGYAVSDDVYLDVMLPEYWKKMTSEMKNGDSQAFKEEGLGDMLVSGRWRFYHDELADQHLAVVLRTSIPTGKFAEQNRARPGLQLGTEALGAGGGLLFSQHIGLFWLNASAEYRRNFENSSDYKFGDILQGGVALHFTPSTRTMLGVEFDANKVFENEDMGQPVTNTGCDSVFGNLVCQRRVALFWGGNFDVRAMAGIPLYENVKGVQLGEAYHFAVGVQWKRRF